nr:class I SAM-dependent methyltransferase [uncultured Acetobacterium sp.]
MSNNEMETFNHKTKGSRHLNHLVEFWNLMAVKYDNLGLPYYANEVRGVSPYLKPDDVVLDLGCATGIFSMEVASHVKAVDGLDVSPKMIEAAKRNAEINGVRNVFFHEGTLCENDLSSRSFDKILAVDVMQYILKPDIAMNRVNSLLKPGGLFIQETVCMGQRLTASFESIYKNCRKGVIPYMNFFTIKELIALTNEAGFEILMHKELPNKNNCVYINVAMKISEKD